MTDIQPVAKPVPISVDKLDELAEFIINPKPNTRLDMAVAAFKIVVVFAYIWARKRLQDESNDHAALQKKRQEYEQAQVSAAVKEVSNEDAFAKAHP